MAAQPKYQRLPGRGTRQRSFALASVNFSRLWLGGDHLLLVDSNGFAETYKRFYFQDIEAITLTRTRWRAILNALFIAPLLVFLALALFNEEPVVRFFCGAIVAFLAVLAAINTFRGPTCRCHLTTAVQSDELASLQRIPRALRVLSRLRPLIAEAQSRSAVPAAAPPPPS